MTPNNIVGMAKLLGLDIIALTDHNTCANCPAIIEAGEKNGICVIPGMELSTSEDIHMVCLFPELKSAMNFSEFVRSGSMHIKNKPEIYGRQVIMNSLDEEIGEEEDLLITASAVSVNDAFEVVRGYGGFCYPAHIDRDSYSITAVLGDFVPECNHSVAGISYNADVDKLRKMYTLNGVNLIQSSDAHYLENMKEATNFIEAEDISPYRIINIIKGNRN